MFGQRSGLQANSIEHVSGTAGRDLVSGAIVFGAIIMFAGSAVDMFVNIIKGALHGTGHLDAVLASTVLLNIALVLFSWRRYRDGLSTAKAKEKSDRLADALKATDALTGLLNRANIVDRGQAMTEHGMSVDQYIVMLMVDLDCFKNVNDVHGNNIGDLVLQAVAERLQADAPEDAVVGRIGGDEFAMILRFDGQSLERVDEVVESVLKATRRSFDINGAIVSISSSIGLARSDVDGSSADVLLRRANIAMHAAKRRGKNRSVWFDAGMESELRLRNDIEQGIRDGVPKGQFVPYFEKQIDLATGTLRGFEVLARWEHPVNGIILPDVFIPIAEETGMIGDLSMSIMEQAFELSRDWDPNLTLSVNISPDQLKDPWLAQKILKLLVKTGFPANRLEIEITETSLFDNLGLAQSIVASLKNQGVRLALDDFGTGYSSLAHLRALPFDRIKIDKSFVMSMSENSDSAAIVDAITRLGESLSLNITAEGIEDLDTLERLKAMGCVKGQGWHYGKPLTAMQVEVMLNAAKGTQDKDRDISVPDEAASVDLSGLRTQDDIARNYGSTAFG